MGGSDMGYRWDDYDPAAPDSEACARADEYDPEEAFVEWLTELVTRFEDKWGCKLGTAEFAARVEEARAGDYDTDDWLLLDEDMTAYRGPDWADEYPPDPKQTQKPDDDIPF